MSDGHTCDVCGQTFKFQSQLRNHKKRTHQGSITDYSDSKELRLIDGMCSALRRNQYDKQESMKDKTTQRTLRNEKVSDKALQEK